MSTEFLVYGKSLYFIAKIKQQSNNKKLDAIAELDRDGFFNHIDKKMDWKGLLVFVKGRQRFIGILRDADEIHRDQKGRFGQMALRDYGANSRRGTLRVIHTAWAANLAMGQWVKHVVRSGSFMTKSDRQSDEGLQAEEAQARNQPAPNTPVGTWCSALTNENGAAQRQYIIGGRGEDAAFVPNDDDYGGAVSI